MWTASAAEAVATIVAAAALTAQEMPAAAVDLGSGNDCTEFCFRFDSVFDLHTSCSALCAVRW